MSTGPSVGVFRQTAGAWIVLGVAWGVVALGAVLWLAGGLATWAAGKGLTGPGFDFQFGEDLFVKGPSHVWPHAALWLVALFFVLLLLVITLPIAAIAVNVTRRRRNVGTPLGALAQENHLEK
jgi:hypothetical protein